MDTRNIFKRCVQCPTTTPTCPSCPKSQICSLVPATCEQCSYMTCIANPVPAPPSSKTNVGGIAGGVVGGMAFMALAIFFLWRFWIKKRREQQELEAEEWEEDEIDQQKGTDRRFTAMRADNASTRTRGSIANSILSRASNIIQIAYIPGVMNRNGSGHNSVAPVPPIPAAYRNAPPKSPLSGENDALFFRPGDLRGSTYSGNSSLRSGNRDTQYTRQSITPSLARSSMMSGHSDVYRDDATSEPMPALTVTRAAPRMVSVKSSATSPSESINSPPPSLPSSVKVMIPGQGNAANSNSAQSVRAKATQITVGKAKVGKNTPNTNASDASTAPSSQFTPATSSPLVSISADDDDEEEEEEEEEHSRARQSLGTEPMQFPLLPLIQPSESPFFDTSETQSSNASPAGNKPNPYATMASSVRNNPDRPNRSSRGPSGLSAVYEESTKSNKTAGRGSESEGEGSAAKPAGGGPFSDAHATK
ncbi:hypothetical protein TI39_contig279g00070 [Zymoseptoria brevis]|uniref:Membrane anchor Opy2 N-terminal domain-containing protein n=1 Tax=Zymoseptoria brevis TaxID=1047168 RepID=A0A0F4GWG1_9PEZI|nr:hypothetical protein TI39_contig279g00070 [Zymoseptoria brevis]